ncbi:hypothetical protein PHLCEN_2v3647 [Hermanssonia centrifuga]|uniref:Uncharacterized protein n=1 Tax=Hermanssonia centrifuga TaxID=98765 RepID=A0A2R6QEN8_9APHY|nr:hypothetical protein PHLCEN_2v3647 [Hermanssonia centrifuga]
MPIRQSLSGRCRAILRSSRKVLVFVKLNKESKDHPEHNMSQRSVIVSHSYQSSVPVYRLPVELLIFIFVLCTGGADEVPRIPSTLSRVCRGWHEIVRSSPGVWQYISLDDHSLSASHCQADIWLKFSQFQPLDVHIHLTDIDSLLPLLSPLLSHIYRWRRCTITGKLEEQFLLPSPSQNPSRTVLDHLAITVRGSLEEHVSTLPIFHVASPSFTTGADVVTSQAYKVSIRVDVLHLPISQHMTTLHLRTLTIVENDLDVVPDTLHLLNFLSFCPYIEVFHFIGFPHDPPTPSARDPFPVVILRKLRSLVLCCTSVMRAILSHIDTPALTELSLEHLNSEFRPGRPGKYSLGEDGDSEDEANDFSQSPWSDHATGMGLRSLIKRSKPPLEILQMDYADMRTKDFLWCFDRLDNLQEFRITASDMSNRVIAMLAPCHDSIPLPRRKDKNRVQEDTPLRIRLPRLALLELCKCQRLPGDDIVNALRERVKYINQFADSGACSILSSVTVSGCPDFKPRHVMALSEILGAKLRASALHV